MTQSKHSAGPWEIRRINEGRGSQRIVGKQMKKEFYQLFSVSAIYAGSTKRADANANLIAAAPEMLEALEEVVRISNPEGSVANLAIIQAEKAIAKAKGEQNE